MFAGLDLVGGIPLLDDNGQPLLTSGAADVIAGAIATSTAFFAFFRLHGSFCRPQNWLNVWDTPAYITGMQTRTTGSSVQSVSVQSERIAELFRHHKGGTPLAKIARGIHEIVQLTGPTLSTICGDPVENSPPDNRVEIRQPNNNSTVFTVAIGPSAGLNFAGAACSLQFFQALVRGFPQWMRFMQPVRCEIGKTSGRTRTI